MLEALEDFDRGRQVAMSSTCRRAMPKTFTESSRGTKSVQRSCHGGLAYRRGHLARDHHDLGATK
jgi:hypothetical protein